MAVIRILFNFFSISELFIFLCGMDLMQAKAMFDFESGGPGELSFYTDELLTIERQVCDSVICHLNLFLS